MTAAVPLKLARNLHFTHPWAEQRLEWVKVGLMSSLDRSYKVHGDQMITTRFVVVGMNQAEQRLKIIATSLPIILLEHLGMSLAYIILQFSEIARLLNAPWPITHPHSHGAADYTATSLLLVLLCRLLWRSAHRLTRDQHKYWFLSYATTAVGGYFYSGTVYFRTKELSPCVQPSFHYSSAANQPSAQELNQRRHSAATDWLVILATVWSTPTRTPTTNMHT